VSIVSSLNHQLVMAPGPAGLSEHSLAGIKPGYYDANPETLQVIDSVTAWLRQMSDHSNIEIFPCTVSTVRQLAMGIYTTKVFFTLVSLLSLALQLLPSPAPGNRIVDGLFQVWVPMTAGDFALSCVAGVVFAGALLSITQACRIARVATVAPFEYSYLIRVTLLGYLLFGDIPGPRTVLGGALVVLCGLYIL
jgi:hypothetical protein